MRAVLMLHSIDDSRSVLSMTASQLASLVHAVRDSGHEIVPLARLLGEPPVGKRVALSFDDGLQSVHDAAAPVLEALRAPATLFLTTGFVGRDNHWPGQPALAPRLPMMAWSSVESLSRAGWDVQAHTVSHPDLRRCTQAELEHELTEPRREIERHLGHTPALLAYPYGYFDARVAQAAARHYRFALSTRMATLDGGEPGAMRIPRLDTLYFRAPLLHARFGSRRFGAYLAARSLLRRLRRHPGECG